MATRASSVETFLQNIPERKRSSFSSYLFSQFCHWEKEGSRIAYKTRKSFAKKSELIRSEDKKLVNEVVDLKRELNERNAKVAQLEEELRKKTLEFEKLAKAMTNLKIEFQ